MLLEIGCAVHGHPKSYTAFSKVFKILARIDPHSLEQRCSGVGDADEMAESKARGSTPPPALTSSVPNFIHIRDGEDGLITTKGTYHRPTITLQRASIIQAHAPSRIRAHAHQPQHVTRNVDSRKLALDAGSVKLLGKEERLSRAILLSIRRSCSAWKKQGLPPKRENSHRKTRAFLPDVPFATPPQYALEDITTAESAVRSGFVRRVTVLPRQSVDNKSPPSPPQPQLGNFLPRPPPAAFTPSVRPRSRRSSALVVSRGGRGRTGLRRTVRVLRDVGSVLAATEPLMMTSLLAAILWVYSFRWVATEAALTATCRPRSSTKTIYDNNASLFVFMGYSSLIIHVVFVSSFRICA